MLIRKLGVYALTLVLALGSLTSLGLTPTAFAQGNTGRLVGTVSSPDGVLAGASVVVRDNQTAKEQTATTNSEGGFQFPQLEFGTYTVTVTMQGFKTFVANDLKIDVGKEYSLPVTLEVGAVTENVTVTAGAEVINATNGELSNTVSPRQIKELPLNGRNPLGLIGLQAGTSQNGVQQTAINGQRSSFTNITRDGVNIQDNFIRANATDFVPDRPNVDDVSEFTIVTQNAGAELGYGSSQIQFVTPRGSNRYHGAGYIYNRNSAFSANTFFNNAVGRRANGTPVAPLPFLNRNQFGGSLGGPITKDKVFFFGSYEGFRLRQSTSALRTVLLPNAREGVFTYLDNTPAAQGGPVRRTLNILQLTGLGIDPLVRSRILSQVPSGNSAEAGDALNTTGFRFSRLQNTDREAWTSRFDYEINSKNSVNLVYAYKKELNLRPDIDGQPGGAAAGFTVVPFGTQDSDTPFLAAAYRMNPTSNFSNEIRGGFQKSDPKFDRTDSPTDFFIQLSLISNPESAFEKQGRNTIIGNFQDNAVWIRGQHSFRIGGQAQIFRVTPYGPGAFGNSTIPTVNLATNTAVPQTLVASQFPGGISSGQLTSANRLLALLAGIVGNTNLTFVANSKNSGFQSGVLPIRHLNYENYSGYFTDQWRVTPQLTLNLGLRYEYFTPIREPNGLALEAAIPEGGDPVAAVLNPNGRIVFVGNNAGGKNFFKPDKNNFAPVISFAWSPEFENPWLKHILPSGGRTVIRGGYRESYVNDEFVRAADNALSGNAGLISQVSQINLNARFDSLPSFTAPPFQVPRTFAQNNLLAGRFGTAFAIDPDLRIPRTQEYNFGIQREIGWNTALEVRYVGGRSNNLVRGKDFNQVDIFNNGFLDDFNRARANLVLTGNPACTTAGCQTLTVFPRLGSGGLLTNATVRANILAGTPADLAIIYVQNGLTGTVPFLPNPNIGVADVLLNDAKYRYNALQTEIRRRFDNGLYLQANYTFQKTLTDAPGTGQTRFEPPLSLFAPEIEYSRADFDQTHVFNFNSIYELPFGKGKPFLNNGGWMDRAIGGFQVTSIIRWSTGAPITITDIGIASLGITRGTLNRDGRSARQTAVTSLNKDQIKSLIGVFKTPCGVFFIDPKVIDFNLETCNSSNVPAGTRIGTGKGANGFGTAAFPGQVFFNNAPGQTSGLERGFINGPVFFNWDASIIKNVPIRENLRVQLRLEAFNVINRANFQVAQFTDLNVNSPNFGRITSLVGGASAPRIIQLVGRIEF